MMKTEQEKFQSLALKQAINILEHKKLTSRDIRKLSALSKIIFDVNQYSYFILQNRLQSLSSSAARRAAFSEQQSVKNSTDSCSE